MGLKEILAAPILPEPAASAQQKPMTFAEKIAEKKRLAAQSGVGSATVPGSAAPSSSPVPGTSSELFSPEAPVQTALSFPSPAAPPVIELTEEQKENLEEVEDSELAQAYSDLALTINKLKYTDDGDDLANAMSALKASIKKNASASMLLLDSDIGQMTMALRRYTRVEVTEAAEEKKSTGGKGRKPKLANTPLTADQIANALADM